MSAPFNAPLLLVTVGGDHHPFDRLMGWVEDLLEAEHGRLRCVVQHGPARLPIGASGSPYIDHSELIALMNQSRAVVSSGGPATLTEARLAGHRPVTVPRQSALGEHVDDHQRLFTTRLHDHGLVVRVETQEEFNAAVVAALDTPRIMSASTSTAQHDAVHRVGELIDATAVSRAGLPRLARHQRHSPQTLPDDAPLTIPEPR